MDPHVPLYDPNSLELLLSPEKQKAVYDENDKAAAAVGELAANFAVAQAHAIAARGALNARVREAQTAHSHVVAFDESAGGQTGGPSKLKDTFVFAALAIAALAETYFAFPGVRFALGQLGQIHSPVDDPLSLFGAAVIGLVSVTAAHMAGQLLSWSERSVIREPEPAQISNQLSAPRAVHADRQNTKLWDGSALSDFDAPPSSQQALYGPLNELSELLPPSREVLNEQASADLRRHEHILRAPRSRAMGRTIALSLILFVLGLWTVSGIMRGAYLARLQPPAAPVTTGPQFFTPPSAPTSKTAGLSSGTTTDVIIAFSMLVFLLSVTIVFAAHPPADLRSKELRRRQSKAQRNVRKETRKATPAIHTFEALRSEIHVQLIKAHSAKVIASLPPEAW